MATLASIQGPAAAGSITILSGIALHPDKVGTPLCHKIARIGSDLQFRFDPYVEVTTDSMGRFSIPVDRKNFKKALYLEFVDSPLELKGGKRVIRRFYLDDDVLGTKGNRPSQVYLGTYKVSHWENQSRIPIFQPPEIEAFPQTMTAEHDVRFVASVAKSLATKVGIYVTLSHNDLDRIQSFFPKSLSMVAEEECPGITGKGEYYAGRLTNGFTRPQLLRTKRGHAKIKINFNEFAFDGSHLKLPNIKLYLSADSIGFRVHDIALQYRKAPTMREGDKLIDPPVTVNGVTDATRLGPWKTYNEKDPGFSNAAFESRTAVGGDGQVANHLGAHLTVDMYMTQFQKYLHKNPIIKLMFPHFWGTPGINTAGATTIFGDHGALTKTLALTAEGVDDLIKAQLSSVDWYGWKPRLPLEKLMEKIDPKIASQVDPKLDQHAHIQEIVWKAVTKVVDKFFEMHQEEIEKEWGEIKQLSDALTRESLPYKPYRGAKKEKWLDPSEIDATDRPRDEEDGVKKAIRRITTSEVATSEGIENLKQVCRYLIQLATLGHSYSHYNQINDLGDYKYAVLALTDGPGRVDPDMLMEQLTLIKTLEDFRMGMILNSPKEDNAVPDWELKIFQEIKDELLNVWGFDMTKMLPRSVMI